MLRSSIRRAAAIGVVLALGAGCLGAPLRPASLPNVTLALPDEASSAAPFRVVADSAGATVSREQPLVVAFSKPIRDPSAWGDVRPRVAEEGAAFAVGGTFRRWGTHVLTWEPEVALAPARKLILSLPADFPAEDGTRLGKVHTIAIESPRPAVVRALPEAPVDARLGVPDPAEPAILGPGEPIDVVFNQSVDPAALKAAARLWVGPVTAPVAMPIDVVRIDPTDPARARITPRDRIARDTRVLLEIDGALRGEQGPLPIGRQTQLLWRSFGALSVRSITCEEDREANEDVSPTEVAVSGARATVSCYNTRLRLRFSNPVSEAALRAGLIIDGVPAVEALPKPGERSDTDPLLVGLTTGTNEDREWVLNVPLSSSRVHEVVVGAEIRDSFGQTLGRPSRFRFFSPVQSFPPISGYTNVRIQPYDDSSLVFQADPDPGADPGTPAARARRKRALEASRAVTVGSEHVRSYTLLSSVLTEDELVRVLPLYRGPTNQEVSKEEVSAIGKLPHVKTSVVRPRSVAAGEEQSVALKSVLGPAKHGACVIAAEILSAEDEDANPATFAAEASFFSVTDLALTARWVERGGLVWVTRISDGKPVAGAEVRLRRRGKKEVLFSGLSNADGVVDLGNKAPPVLAEDGAPDPDIVLIARSGEDWAFRRASDTLEERYAPRSAPGLRAWSRSRGLVHTDKAQYDAGEEVWVMGAVTPADKQPRSAPGSVRVRVGRDPEHGREGVWSDEAVPLSASGAFWTKVKLPVTAQPGSFEVRVDGGPGRHASTAAAVAPRERLTGFTPASDEAYWAPSAPDYMLPKPGLTPFPIRLEVLPEQTAYLYGEPMGVRVRASYAPGMGAREVPMPGLAVQCNILIRLDAFAPEVEGDFMFPTMEDARSVSFMESAILDEAGAAQIRLLTTLSALSRHAWAEWRCSTRTPWGLDVEARAAIELHPGPTYLGIRMPRALTRGQTFRPEVTVVDPSGRPFAGVQVELELGVPYTAARPPRCVFASDLGPTGCDLVASDPSVRVITAKWSDKSRTLMASWPVHVAEDTDASLAEASSGITLIPDKEVYSVGETAVVRIEHPLGPSEALFAVERGAVLWRARKALSGRPENVLVPITAAMAPVVHLSADLVRGWRPEGPSDEEVESQTYTSGPGFVHAEVPLRVGPGASPLRVRVRPVSASPGSASSAPNAITTWPVGAKMDVDIDVKDSANRALVSRIGFYAVHESAALQGSVRLSERIARAARAIPPPGWSLYSMEELATPQSHVWFRSPSAWLIEDPLVLHATPVAAWPSACHMMDVPVNGGHTRVSCTLPSKPGIYQLTAFAVGADGQIGTGVARVRAANPISVIPSFAGRLTLGDHAEARVVVIADEDVGPAEIAVTARGGLRPRGEARVPMSLHRGARLFSFPIEAMTEGSAELVFRVRAGDRDVVARAPVWVSPAGPRRTAVRTGIVGSGAREGLGDLRGMTSGAVSVRIGPSPWMGVPEAARAVLSSPSNDSAIALASEIALSGRVAESDVGGKLAALQHADGGFGDFGAESPAPHLGPRSPTAPPPQALSEAWISAQVACALRRAIDRGAPVDRALVSRLAAFLERWLAESSETGKQPTIEAWARLGIALHGRRLPARARPDGNAPWIARALDGWARSVANEAASAPDPQPSPAGGPEPQMWSQDIDEVAPIAADGTAMVVLAPSVAGEGFPGTDVWATAVALHVVLRTANAPEAAGGRYPEIAAALARGLLARRNAEGAWASPLETAWAASALDAFASMNESPEIQGKIEWTIHGRSWWQAAIGASPAPARDVGPDAFTFPEVRPVADRRIGMDALRALHPEGGLLQITCAGCETANYEVRIQGHGQGPSAAIADRGIVVDKVMTAAPVPLAGALPWWMSLRIPEKQGRTALRAGERAIVDVLVGSQAPRDHVIIEDRLPAGIERVSGVRIEGGEAVTHVTEDGRIRVHVSSLRGFVRLRYEVAAVSLGEGELPPATAWLLYAPEVKGSSASGRTMVEAVEQ